MNHIDQAEDDQHDVGFVERRHMGDEVPDFLQEQDDVDALRHDQAEIQRHLEPAAHEDDCWKGLHGMAGRTGAGDVRGCGHERCRVVEGWLNRVRALDVASAKTAFHAHFLRKHVIVARRCNRVAGQP
jgi:hypothetical protein